MLFFAGQGIIAFMRKLRRKMKREVLGPILVTLLAGAFVGYFGASGSQAAQIPQLQYPR